MPGEKALAALIRERIELLPEEERAGAEVVAARLAVCKGCDRLVSGTCALCGCYVELRAAKGKQRCPEVPAKW